MKHHLLNAEIKGIKSVWTLFSGAPPTTLGWAHFLSHILPWLTAALRLLQTKDTMHSEQLP